MIIEETHECNPVSVRGDLIFDIRQTCDWIQLDKQQATQLIEVLTKWVNGEEVE